MDRVKSNTEHFVQYGIESELAARASAQGLTVTKVRTLPVNDIVQKYSINTQEAKILKYSAQRQPIDDDIVHSLLERSNYTCNICHGTKGGSFIIHHITPYAKTQDNTYGNLIVLCPNDHDRAHGNGLSMGLTSEMLTRAKEKWETQVIVVNAVNAARLVEVEKGTVDYINVRRIEELCLNIFGKIPETKTKYQLQADGILNKGGFFQQKYVLDNLSSGRFLFDYINSGEALHYGEILSNIAQKIHFEDLTAAVDSGKRAVQKIEGKYAFFIGGVWSKRPDLPINHSSPEVIVHYTRRRVRVEWRLDPNFLFLCLQSGGREQKTDTSYTALYGQ